MTTSDAPPYAVCGRPGGGVHMPMPASATAAKPPCLAASHMQNHQQLSVRPPGTRNRPAPPTTTNQPTDRTCCGWSWRAAPSSAPRRSTSTPQRTSSTGVCVRALRALRALHAGVRARGRAWRAGRVMARCLPACPRRAPAPSSCTGCHGIAAPMSSAAVRAPLLPLRLLGSVRAPTQPRNGCFPPPPRLLRPACPSRATQAPTHPRGTWARAQVDLRRGAQPDGLRGDGDGGVPPLHRCPVPGACLRGYVARHGCACLHECVRACVRVLFWGRGGGRGAGPVPALPRARHRTAAARGSWCCAGARRAAAPLRTAPHRTASRQPQLCMFEPSSSPLQPPLPAAHPC